MCRKSHIHVPMYLSEADTENTENIFGWGGCCTFFTLEAKQNQNIKDPPTKNIFFCINPIVFLLHRKIKF